MSIDFDRRYNAFLRDTIELALKEDLGADLLSGDLTSTAVVGAERGAAVIVACQDGVFAGEAAAKAVFEFIDPELEWEPRLVDGVEFAPGQEVASVRGSLRAILGGERTALNFLSEISGVATLTRRFVLAANNRQVRIFDTRKTTPGLRGLQKYAVAVGGGFNHRFGLYDGVLIKDNHLVGRTILEAVAAARSIASSGMKIEIEVESIAELKEALTAGADIVLLDNMDLETLQKAIGIAKGKVEIEVSGGVKLENIEALAALGPDRISVGALTQAAVPIDFSLRLTERF